MLKTLYLISLLLIFFLGSSSRKDGISKQQKDLEVFKKVILSKESRIDIHANLDSVLYYFNALDATFSKKLTQLEQFKYYSQVLTKIESGHTQIHPTRNLFKDWLSDRNSLPIDYYLLGKRLIINNIVPLDLKILALEKSKYQSQKKISAGSEILSINNKTVPQMMSEIAVLLSSDENSIDFKYYQAAQLFEFYRHLSDPFTQDSISVKYVYRGDTNLIYLLPGTAPFHTMNDRLSKSELRYQKNQKNLGEFAIVKKCGYFRFKSFSNSYGVNYEAFLKRSFLKLKAKKINRLIIDLRGNTGGAMQYQLMRYFVGENVFLGKYIVGKPKKFFESRHFKKLSPAFTKHRKISHEQKRLQRKGKFNNGTVLSEAVDVSLIYEGEIVLITDEGTFSSAAILACYLKSMKNAKIIGQRAGGSFYRGNAGTITLKLPHSKLQIFVNPNTFYSHLDESSSPLEIKEPDVYLSSILTDIKKRDRFYIKAAINAFK